VYLFINLACTCTLSRSHALVVAVIGASCSLDLYIDKILHTRIGRRNDESYGFIDVKPNRWKVDAKVDWSRTRSFSSRPRATRSWRGVRGFTLSIHHNMLRPRLLQPRCKPSGFAGPNLRLMLEYIRVSATERILTCDPGAIRSQ